MCLELIDSKAKRTTVGYKVVDVGVDGALYPRYQRIGRSFSKNSWMKEEDYRKEEAADYLGIRAHHFPHKCYRPGFHSYRKLKCAVSFARSTMGPNTVVKVVKVGVRGVTVTGLQSSREVVVSQEIRILEEVSCA